MNFISNLIITLKPDLQVNFLDFDNSWYDPGKGFIMRTIWYFVNLIVFQSYFFPFYRLKTLILRAFGATVGSQLVIKPCVNIKYPWHLKIGNNVWIGENVWIDNLTEVILGNNVCISQGAMLLTGNHNYKKKEFDLLVGKVILEDGVWIGARSTVCPGTQCASHSVLSVGSVANGNMDPYTIYQGVPAKPIRIRKISE